MVIVCSTRVEVEEYIGSYIEQLKNLESTSITNARICEAEAIKNNSGGMWLGKMIVLVAEENDCIYGALMATEQQKKVLNIDHITAYNKRGHDLIRKIIEIAKVRKIVTITLCAAGDGDTVEKKTCSQKTLIDFYSKFGFKQTAPSSGIMELFIGSGSQCVK